MYDLPSPLFRGRTSGLTPMISKCCHRCWIGLWLLQQTNKQTNKQTQACRLRFHFLFANKQVNQETIKKKKTIHLLVTFPFLSLLVLLFRLPLLPPLLPEEPLLLNIYFKVIGQRCPSHLKWPKWMLSSDINPQRFWLRCILLKVWKCLVSKLKFLVGNWGKVV